MNNEVYARYTNTDYVIISMRIIINILFLFLLGCSFGKQGVYFNEMSKRPRILLLNNTLIVKTSNSIKNSALLIYEIIVKVDHKKKTVYLSANQSVGKKYKESFTIDLSKYNIKELETYSFVWLDPDNNTTKLEIHILQD